jgi:hypothetical protein
VVPDKSSPRSKSETSNPRKTRSWAIAAPVPPPPMITIFSINMLKISLDFEPKNKITNHKHQITNKSQISIFNDQNVVVLR